MAYRTVQEIISENPHLKPASFYNAIMRSIKDGPLRGRAIPLNRNDPAAKFKLNKAVTRGGRAGQREVTNFVILDQSAFDAWFEENKNGIRSTRAMGRSQVVMPRLDEIQSGEYSPEQLRALAEHVANRRYGVNRGRKSGGQAAAAAAPAKKPRTTRKSSK
ncbi:MAG TPA: hypothetical protein VNT60_01370 [Deinococcales bacterium]|nr:hypothetical protein [Deinococcales bacterium]